VPEHATHGPPTLAVQFYVCACMFCFGGEGGGGGQWYRGTFAQSKVLRARFPTWDRTNSPRLPPVPAEAWTQDGLKTCRASERERGEREGEINVLRREQKKTLDVRLSELGACVRGKVPVFFPNPKALGDHNAIPNMIDK